MRNNVCDNPEKNHLFSEPCFIANILEKELEKNQKIVVQNMIAFHEEFILQIRFSRDILLRNSLD